MQVFHSIEDVVLAEGPKGPAACAVAIGNFDGVHRGHEALLRRLVADAAAQGLRSAVLTFFPHPVEVLRPGTRLERLSTTEEKLALLEAVGIDVVVVEKFRPELAALTPEQFFARFLAAGLRAGRVHVGHNFRFGKDRAGTIAVLAKLCAAHGIVLREEPWAEIDGEKISSSGIREKVVAGDMEGASAWLGRPYTITGQVEHGDHRGTQLGFPTANVHVPYGKCLPRLGVYVTRTRWQRQDFASVTNFGLRPSVQPTDGVSSIRMEVHLLDASVRLYGESLHVEFLHFVRDEKKFASLDALREQIALDVAVARAFAF